MTKLVQKALKSRFHVDLSKGSLSYAKRAVLSDFSPAQQKLLAVDAIEIPSYAKVSCQYGDACTSPSRRDQTKPKAWLCGSRFSHDDRMAGCVAYCRFERFLQSCESGIRRLMK